MKHTQRLFWFVLATVLGISIVVVVPGTNIVNASTRASAGERITLLFFDRHGTALSVKQVRSISNNGKAGYNTDALVDPQNMREMTNGPLVESGAKLAFELPARPVAFAFNWPTKPLGYSMIVLDNGGAGFTTGGTVNFTYQAALDYKRRLDASLAERSTYVPSAKFLTAYDSVVTHIDTATSSTDEAVRGKEGQLALDQLAVAYDTLLEEWGPVYAKANKATTMPQIGFTFDTVDNYKARLDLASRISRPFGWVRFVFDLDAKRSQYVAPIKYAHSLGLKVMGQPADSSYDKRLSLAAYEKRFKQYVNTLPTVDAWELGNEVNGSWLSPTIARKVATAASYVKSRGKQTVLTLFWQVNTDVPKYSMFNWVHTNLPASVRKNIDVVFMSVYVEQAPLGLAFEQVMDTLAAEFPEAKIGIGELDYWIEGQRFWWAYSRAHPISVGLPRVAAHFYPASLAFPNSVGGCYWWNFVREFPGHPKRQAIVSNLRDQLK